jgi:two-component sensor histidine kinase
MTLVDATEQRNQEAEDAIVVGELRHRLKNLLALVTALARQSRVEQLSATAYRDALLGRLNALGRSLERSLSGETGSLGGLVTQAIEPYAHLALFDIDGPELILGQKLSLAVAMILHELFTNSAKYGALSSGEGTVKISWRLDKAEEFQSYVTLSWTETGGPTVSSPAAEGYGTRMIRTATALELKGTAELEYAPEGFRGQVRFPHRCSPPTTQPPRGGA